MGKAITITSQNNNSNFWTNAGVSPSSGIHLGAGVCLVLWLLTSFGKTRSRRFSIPSALTLTILSAFLGAVGLSSFSHSAYAASYINVSSGSGGTVSLGSIRPSSSGTSSTGSDTLTIHTDCSTGYSVYVSGQKDKDTNLTNTNSNVTSNNTISASSTTVGSTATALDANTWGLNSENTGTYVGLPTYDNATNKALTSKSSVSESSTVPIYYGVKVDTNLTPGTYTGNILYTVLPNSACATYTVRFNANGGSGTMNNQTITVGQATNLSTNTFARSGYTFLGWSTSSTGEKRYYDRQPVTDLASFNSTIDLYAVWGQVTGDMQTFECSALSAGQTVYLKDLRDDSVYTVKKYASDGNCWMASNLVLGYDKGYALTSELTNISDSGTYYIPKAGYQGAGLIADDSRSSTTAATWTDNSTNDKHAKVQYKIAGSDGDLNSVSGYTLAQNTSYYNFYTATLGCSWYQGDDSCTTGYITRDICPKSWQLPAGGSSITTKSWVALDKDLNGSSAGSNRTDTMARDMFLNMADFFYSGQYYTSSLYNVGSYGYWWSSTVYNIDYGYFLYLDSGGNIYPQVGDYKYVGFAVRCVAQDNYTITYSSDGADGGEASKTSETVFQNNGTVNVTMPTAGTMVKSGYEFKGWALISGATEAAYTAEESVSLTTLLSAASSAGQTTTPGSTLTLYPVWKISIPDDGNLGTMQDFVCNNLTSGHTATLTDSRDNQTYKIYRIPVDQTYAGTSTIANVAGKCIMTKDLNLGAVAFQSSASSKMTSANSNMTISPNDSGFTTPTGSGESISVPTSNVTVSNAFSSTNSYSNKYYKADGTGNYAGRGYYSWGAAMVVCPKGWRLPTADEYYVGTAGGYETQTGGIAAIVKGADFAESIANITNSPYSFVLGGLYYNSFNSAPSVGEYWSSTQDHSSAYRLAINSSNGLLRYSELKSYGRPVRCIADEYPDDGNLGTMQAFNCANLTSGHTATLTDSRDNQTYKIYRVPTDQTYKGSTTTANIAGKCIMAQDLMLGYNSAGNLSLTTSTSAASGTVKYINPANGGTGWNTTDSDSNLQYTYGPRDNYADYSSHSYYSFGAAKKVCSKGWRLPTGAEYGSGGSSETQTTGLAAIVGNDTNGSKALQALPWNFTLGGYFDSSGWVNQGSDGTYWSSTQYDTSSAYSLYFYSSVVYRSGYGSKSSGRSVRCIAD